MRIVNDKIALIENELLCRAIWGDTSCRLMKPRFAGYIQASTDKVGKAFLEYCIAKIYGIYRLPKCGYDNYIENCEYWRLDEKEIADACKEFEQVINHVQSKLVYDYHVENGKASVVRCLARYQLYDAEEQLRDEAKNEIEIPVSIFSSYSYDGIISQLYPTGNYEGKHINIKEDVSINDIILWDSYVGNGRRGCLYEESMADCECELWVVDRSITGRKKLNRSCFYYTEGLPKLSFIEKHMTEFGSDRSVYRDDYIYRPCECEDLLTKYVINRNIRRCQNREN